MKSALRESGGLKNCPILRTSLMDCPIMRWWVHKIGSFFFSAKLRTLKFLFGACNVRLGHKYCVPPPQVICRREGFAIWPTSYKRGHAYVQPSCINRLLYLTKSLLLWLWSWSLISLPSLSLSLPRRRTVCTGTPLVGTVVQGHCDANGSAWLELHLQRE